MTTPKYRFILMSSGYTDKATREHIPIWHLVERIPGRPATRNRPATRTQHGPIIASFGRDDPAYEKRQLYHERWKQKLPLDVAPQEIALTKLCEQKEEEWDNRWQDSSLWQNRASTASWNDPSPLQKELLAAVADLEYFLTSDDRGLAFRRTVSILESLLEHLTEACDAFHRRMIERVLDDYFEIDPQDEEAWRDWAEDICNTVAAMTNHVGETEIGETLIEHYEALSERYDQWRKA